MGIKKKKSGPSPLYDTDWKNLAKHKANLQSAIHSYMKAHPYDGIVIATTAVYKFHRAHVAKFGDGQ